MNTLEEAQLAHRQLNEALGSHLGEPVEVFFRMQFSIQNVYGPNFVSVLFTDDMVRKLFGRALACVEHELTRVSAPVTLAQDDDESSEVGKLTWFFEQDQHVFRIVGKSQDGGQSESDWIRPDELLSSIIYLRTDVADDKCFMEAYAGCLFHSGDVDTDYFIDDVIEKLPEVQARQTALDMAQHLDASPAAATDPAAKTQAKRRLNL